MKNIMFVDDELIMRDLFEQAAKFFLKNVETRIIFCDNMEAAIKKYNEFEGKIDLVITDSGLSAGGDGGGAELIKFVRSNNDKIPVIVITGAEEKFRFENPDMQEIPVFGKPFRLKSFMEFVAGKVGVSAGNNISSAVTKYEPA